MACLFFRDTIMLMVIVTLLVLGLALGSFVNALVWRFREQELEAVKKKPNKKYLNELSIARGRSMCTHCKHELGPWDLIPVMSWVWLKGKCRYCRKPISAQYPVVELVTAVLFVASYVWWPNAFSNEQIIIFGLWLILLVGFMALTVYDLRWFLLPNRIVYPLAAIAGSMALIRIVSAENPAHVFTQTLLAVAVGGGIFYVLFQVSAGKWIGGGDVKLGWLLGLTVGTPELSVLFIFLASLTGVAVSLPLLMSRRMKGDSIIPFGPFLIFGAIIAQLFGQAILVWYRRNFLSL